MREKGYAFDPEQVGRLERAFEMTLERLRVDAADHDVKKRLARTLMKIAKRRAEDASPEDLSSAVVDRACAASAPPERSAWVNTVRSTPPRQSCRGTSSRSSALGAATGILAEFAHKSGPPYQTTPDGRYLVVRGRLWRCSNPALGKDERHALTSALISARRAKQSAMRKGDRAAKETARRAVDEAKHALGERGPAWWTDGAPDYNRKMVWNTPYKAWFEAIP